MPRGYQYEDPTGCENTFDLAAGLRQIIDKLQGTDRNHGLKKTIFIRHLRSRSTHQLRVHTVLGQNLRNVIGEGMRVDTVKLVCAPR